MADKQVDRPAPSEEATCLECGDIINPILADWRYDSPDVTKFCSEDCAVNYEHREQVSALRRQIAQLREALNRMLIHFAGDEELCIECGENANEGCDTCYVIISAKQALSSTATEKTEAEK